MFQRNDRRVQSRASAPLLLAILIAVLSGEWSSAAQAQVRNPSTGLRGSTTTQNGAMFLPGVVVTVTDTISGAMVAEATSDDTGKFEVANLKPGTYTVRAFLEGFAEALKQSVQIIAGRE